ncbi:MAG: hypothetical protein H5T86_12175, partial [Armatimonadetes bacterium]|nr:hypothetical protein [Armatimonadota bacterium]
PCPETGFSLVDAACPVILANYAAGFDPADAVAQVRWLVGLLDSDSDGQADRWPGVLARFRWADALSIPPSGHALVSAVALAAGARGVFETWAQSENWSDAALAVPEEIYLRWEQAFCPALSLHDYLLSATPVTDAAVWRSWAAAAMAKPGDEAEAAAVASAQGWLAILCRVGFLPRTVSDEAIAAGRLSGVKVLAVPSVLCASDEARSQLEAFARRGGILLLGPGSLALDKFHRPTPRPSFMQCETAGTGLSPIRLAAPATLRDGLEVGRLVSDAWRPGSEADVLLRDGKPVVWAWRVGKGWVVYFAAEPLPTSRWEKWLREWLRSHGAAPTAECSPGARALVSELAQDRRLVVVYNAGPVGKQETLPRVRVSLAVQGGPRVEELVREQPARYNRCTSRLVEVTLRQGRLEFTTDLRPHEFRAYLVLSSG